MLGQILNVVKNVLKGFVSGIIASFIGYAKKEEVPTWDLKKMLQEVVLGGFTSAIIYGSGMPIGELAGKIAIWLEVEALTAGMIEFAILTGMVILVDHIVKIIVRRSEIMTLWNKFKEFISNYI